MNYSLLQPRPDTFLFAGSKVLASSLVLTYGPTRSNGSKLALQPLVFK
jgi:hypothetical protein